MGLREGFSNLVRAALHFNDTRYVADLKSETDKLHAQIEAIFEEFKKDGVTVSAQTVVNSLEDRGNRTEHAVTISIPGASNHQLSELAHMLPGRDMDDCQSAQLTGRDGIITKQINFHLDSPWSKDYIKDAQALQSSYAKSAEALKEEVGAILEDIKSKQHGVTEAELAALRNGEASEVKVTAPAAGGQAR